MSISDDGDFSADYVVPPALSIPLGTSGSSVDVVKNEDGTFSANGEVITAATRVTAENGNVYAAVLSPEGIPVGVMHVAAMQDAQLGALGGTLSLTQLEDKSWVISGSDTAVTDGYVHTAANGNMYALMMDADGMWSGTYQEVMVTVALGTQGSVTLTRAEDMSWWLGSEAVMAGSMVNSANGNEYMLSMSDGVWTAMFQPESMMIEGTGLVAMTREGDNMYDVGDDTLAASGVGDVTVDGAMYHVWMDAGALMGARFDDKIDTDNHTRRTIDVKGDIGDPALSANDADTTANELRTHLIVTGNATDGKGMFSFGQLLGDGTATSDGKRFVDVAVDKITKARGDVSALLGLDTEPTGLSNLLDDQWDEVQKALDKIFNTDSQNVSTDARTSAVRLSTPRQEDILDEIDDILDALSSEDSFVAATAEGGRGAFDSEKGNLAAGKAADTFNRLKWTATATLGKTGSTRYGTALRQSTMYAVDKLQTTDSGAFSYATMEETARTADAAAVSLTGSASYSGGTHAMSGAGVTYTGMMDVQVRFNANTVSGVVRDLEVASGDDAGLPWQYNFADVDRIVLGDAKLARNAKWNDTSASTNKATVFFTADSGLLRPVSNVHSSFQGILLGKGANAGSEANGVWSVGTSGSSTYLAGGFGVMHVGDTSRPVPSGDDGSTHNSSLVTTSTTLNTGESVSIADGNFKVKLRAYGWQGDTPTNPTYGARTSDGNNVTFTATFSLAEMAAKANGATTAFNGPKHVGEAIKVLQAQREQLEALQSLGTRSYTAEAAAWVKVQQALRTGVLGQIPGKLAKTYTETDTELQGDALGLIDRALDALKSADALAAALDPDKSGIFNHYLDGDTETDFVDANGKINARTAANIVGELSHKVITTLGTTDLTRFGAWRRQDTRNAIRAGADNDPDSDDTGAGAGTANRLLRDKGGPGTFAYSPLDPAIAGTDTNPGFPLSGEASYTGETVALQNTTVLTGTVRVDVSWEDSLTTRTTANAGDQITAGTMSLTISGLQNGAGDPLTHDGSSSTPGTEIADIIFSDLTIYSGQAGDNSGHLIVGANGSPVEGNYTYTEVSEGVNTRYRFSSVGTTDHTANPTTDSVKALFVGQGVDGPLGVIGTWTLQDSSLGRLHADGTKAQDLGTTTTNAIYGAFGAEAP